MKHALLVLPILLLTACSDGVTVDAQSVPYEDTCAAAADYLILMRGVPTAVTLAEEGSSYSTMYWYDDLGIRYEMISDFSGTCRRATLQYTDPWFRS